MENLFNTAKCSSMSNYYMEETCQLLIWRPPLMRFRMADVDGIKGWNTLSFSHTHKHFNSSEIRKEKKPTTSIESCRANVRSKIIKCQHSLSLFLVFVAPFFWLQHENYKLIKNTSHRHIGLCTVCIKSGKSIYKKQEWNDFVHRGGVYMVAVVISGPIALDDCTYGLQSGDVDFKLIEVTMFQKLGKIFLCLGSVNCLWHWVTTTVCSLSG